MIKYGVSPRDPVQILCTMRGKSFVSTSNH